MADVAKSTITISDTGAGLTESEIHGFLATVGVGYTRMLRQQDDDTGLIGMFGLGFLSAFVLAKDVTVLTTSWQTPDQGWKYHSVDGQRYTVTPSDAVAPGTQVILTLKEEYSHLASNNLLNRVLSRYCILLHEPVFVGDATEPVNKLQPPWRESTPEGVTMHRALVQRKTSRSRRSLNRPSNLSAPCRWFRRGQRCRGHSVDSGRRDLRHQRQP